MNANNDSEDLVRVGPGTAMGELMRQYWLPALASTELARDAAPTRLMLLNERLIAFRDSEGRVGVMDHRCPHRCASLFLGRNEAGGVRCVYHGWKFDVTGKCLEMPSVPPEQDYKDKVHAKAYRVAERNGVIWVYMGSREEPPPLPAIEASLLPESELKIQFVQRSCNWLQALEGDIDTSHFGFLHVGGMEEEDFHPDDMLRHTVKDRAPQYEVSDASWGTTYAAKRPGGEGQTYWRFANFMMPFWTQTPQGDFNDHVGARAWVPMDDEHTMFIYLRWAHEPDSVKAKVVEGSRLSLINRINDYRPNDTTWHGRWRLKADEGNDWSIDREAQSSGMIFTGINNVHLQDQAVTESMGPITDRSFEHLGPADRMIARTRRRLLLAARALRDNGTVPPGVDDPTVYLKSRSGYFLVDNSVDWKAAYEQKIKFVQRPAPMPVEAE